MKTSLWVSWVWRQMRIKRAAKMTTCLKGLKLNKFEFKEKLAEQCTFPWKELLRNKLRSKKLGQGWYWWAELEELFAKKPRESELRRDPPKWRRHTPGSHSSHQMLRLYQPKHLILLHENSLNLEKKHLRLLFSGIWSFYRNFKSFLIFFKLLMFSLLCHFSSTCILD